VDSGNTLRKEERLRGDLVFSYLFDNGHSFFQFPYKVFWVKVAETGSVPVRFAVSVPKKRFKRAVKRNLLKRRTREAFRTNKQILHDAVTDDGGQVHMIVIYSHDALLPFADLDEAMKKILGRIAKHATFMRIKS